MLSFPSHEYTDSLDTTAKPDNRAKPENRIDRLADRLDEIAVFVFVALAVMYIAAATTGLW